MTSTIRVGEPRELLALIPHQLGFVPTDSAALVSLRAPRSRVGLVARADLADLSDPEFGPQLARSLVAHLDSDRAVACIVVCYVSPCLDNGGQVPVEARAALKNLERAVDGFIPIDGLLLVDGTCFHVVGPEFEALEPGRSLTELQATAVGAHMVVAGNRVARDRTELGALAPVADKHARTANAVRRTWSRAGELLRSAQPDDAGRACELVELVGPRGPRTIQQWRAAGLRSWRLEVDRAAAHWGHQSTRARPSTWGKLSAALDDVVVRDAVLLSLVVGATRLPERTLGSAGHDSDIGAAMAAIMDPEVGEQPKAHIIDPSRQVLRTIVAHAPEQRSAPGATLLALIAWWQGKGAEASVWLDHAYAADPGYRLAGLLAEAIDSGMPPGWARARQRSHD